jgi:RHS repeat-associated protein
VYNDFSSYDLSGNRPLAVQATVNFADASASYFTGDNRLRALDHRRSSGSQIRGTFEEYRYDALGRRILVRSNRTNLCTGQGCISEIKGVVWDGDQVLFELRADGSGAGPDSASDPGATLESYDTYIPTNSAQYGRTGYVHGLGIDKPLTVDRLISTGANYFIPHANWHGLDDQGTLGMGTTAGSLITCSGVGCINWPALTNDLYYSELARQDANPDSWSGDLVNQSRDISGQIYMRNRYYDPGTGRFTQEDPIGLSGGLNVYGFAAGDPVNHSDPFGLCPTLPCGRDDADPLRDRPLPPGIDAGDVSWNPEGWYDHSDGRRIRPHPEDNGHWDHWEVFEPGAKQPAYNYPEKKDKPWPGQKRKPYGDQSPGNPWPISNYSIVRSIIRFGESIERAAAPFTESLAPAKPLPGPAPSPVNPFIFSTP